MNKHRILAATAILLLFAACDKNHPAADDTPKLIELGAEGDNINASVDTKVTEVTSLDGFNLSATKGTIGSEQPVWDNVSFTATGSSPSRVYTGNKYWPAQNLTYHFYASNIAMNNSTSDGVTIQVTNDTDIVCAFKQTPTFKERNTLNFEHILARLGDVTVTPASGYTISNVQISITPNTGGTYAIRNGSGWTNATGWSNITSGSPVVISDSTCPSTKSNDFFLVPGAYTLTASWKANIDEFECVYTNKSVIVDISSGKINNITATLGGDAEQVKFSVSVNAWTARNIETIFPVY